MPFDLVTPTSPEEAVALLDPEDPSVRLIAGGTALMLMIKSGLYRPHRLVSLRALTRELGQVRDTADGGLRIGAMVRLAELEQSQSVRTVAPVITRTMLTHSNVRVRNAATVGGNLAHADPHMDLPPVLIALGAEVEAIGPAARRKLAVENLYTGYFETVLAANELVTDLIIPPQHGRHAAYVKCTTRAADDWPAIGLAVSLAISDGIIGEPRIAIGAATETPIRLKRAEAHLSSAALEGSRLREAARIAGEEAPVIADSRGSAAYKKVLVAVHLERLLRQLSGQP